MFHTKHPHLLAVALSCILLNVFLVALLLLQTNARMSSHVKGDTTTKLLTSPWHMEGLKTFSVQSIPLQPNVFQDKDTITLTYDLHGMCLLPGKASEIAITDVQEKRYTQSLADYGTNCANGEQTVHIPLAEFGINTATQPKQLFVTFWYPAGYTIDIIDISIEKNVLGASTKRTKTAIKTPSNSPTIEPTHAATASALVLTKFATPSGQQSWAIQSVSSMKVTKDAICSPASESFIKQWVDSAKMLGVNYISIETPYDSPACGNTLTYTKAWIDAIRARGISVWHRHMPLRFEGIYNMEKDNTTNYISFISDYIKAHPDFFQAGDIFTPIPEPQNGGIQGITYCPDNICMFKDAKDFNNWLRTVMTESENAFASIGLAGKIKIGYFGFDGFVTWGDNNPDWTGILEDATVKQMGNITIDHYPEIVGDTMQNDLNELQAKYPHVPIVIGEWGTVSADEDPVVQINRSMQAAKRKNVVGFNYWHMGMGGNESLINDDFSHKPSYAAVQSFFISQ